MRCARCGEDNPAESRFCGQCGAPLPGTGERSDATSTIALHALDDHDDDPASEATPGAVAAVESLPSGSALLIVKRGPNAGSRFLLDKDITTAGRHPESDIFLDDVTVSRRHVEFRRDAAGGFSVRDVGSLNGTYLNRERIESTDLAPGDEVQIGKFRLMFFSGAADGAEASA